STGQLAAALGGEGFALLLLALGEGRPARLRVGVEEPGYPSLRRVPARFGATVVPVPVDEHGLRVADLPAGVDALDLLIVTPSHQYPMGGSLPIDRRQELLEWARRHRVVIVEDDYDSELRYTSEPLPALAALDDPSDGRVVLLGTLAKTLTPALATGFLALPAWLVPTVTETRAELGLPVGLVPQRAVANYLESGALRLHTQRMRNRYRRRRAQVVAALSDVPGLRVSPMDGGLHAVVETRRPEADVVADLAEAGVRVSPLSEYWAGAGSSGIVFGFGAVTEADLAHGLGLIAAASRVHA
ncbi:MAG TPA: PLP-dependent aminotransferase family protein, partial [Arachnia sp.]|nr:PLP-dependent aminotransferase family protein [Arachnia sp.]